MPVTIAPSDEACQAIVSRINSGSGLTYTLPSAAEYFYELSEDLRSQSALEVDVIHDTETDLVETLDTENPTLHTLRIVVRKKLPGKVATATVSALKLIARQIFQRVNSYAGTSRVTLWDVGVEDADSPDKGVLRTHGLFAMSIAVKVRVEASA